MQITSTRKAAAQSTQKPPTQDKEYIQSQVPCHTDDYVLRTKVMVPVENPSAETYRKVCGASGAARGAVVGHAAMFVGGAALGAALGNAMFAGSSALAGTVGGALGLVGGGYLHAKTLLGRRVGSVAGAIVGQAVSPLVNALGLEVSEERADITRDFSVMKLVKNGGDFFHSSIPNISREASQNFVKGLQPGDVVLTKHEGSTIFNLLTYIPSGQYDFNHSILYIGHGKAIEATTGKGVHEFDLTEELTHKHHCIAVRPKLEEGQAPKVIQAARDMKGKAYDYLFKETTNTLYCSELIDHSYEVGAPQVKFNERSFLTKAFTLPGDLLKTDGEVVAEAGEHHSYLNGMASKFS